APAVPARSGGAHAARVTAATPAARSGRRGRGRLGTAAGRTAVVAGVRGGGTGLGAGRVAAGTERRCLRRGAPPPFFLNRPVRELRCGMRRAIVTSLSVGRLRLACVQATAEQLDLSLERVRFRLVTNEASPPWRRNSSMSGR